MTTRLPPLRAEHAAPPAHEPDARTQGARAEGSGAAPRCSHRPATLSHRRHHAAHGGSRLGEPQTGARAAAPIARLRSPSQGALLYLLFFQVRLLLRHGANPNEVDGTGKAILCGALAAAGSSKGTCTFEFTDAHCKSKLRDYAAAPAARSLAVARALLDAGARVASGLNRYGYSVLHYACEIGVPDVIQLLLNKGAASEVNLPTNDDYWRQSPLHFAVTGADRIGCTYDTNDPDAVANMVFAAKQRDVPSVVQALVAAGARVDARDADGQTPLHLAMGQAQPQLMDVIALLKAGANPLLKGAHGMVPAHELRPYAKLLTVLSQHGIKL